MAKRKSNGGLPKSVLATQQRKFALIVVIFVLLVWKWYDGDFDRAPQNHAPATTSSASSANQEQDLAPGVYRVKRAVDGDTLALESGKRIRLIGANTPETVKQNTPVEKWGPEASQFTKDFVSGGQVRLEFDKEKLDKYGRTLAYVWVGDRMLNEELIRAGLAHYEPNYRYAKEMKARFKAAENEAKAARRGLWSE